MIDFVNTWLRFNDPKDYEPYLKLKQRMKVLGVFGPLSNQESCVTAHVNQPVLVASEYQMHNDSMEHPSDEMYYIMVSILAENNWKAPKKMYFAEDMVSAPSLKELKEASVYGVSDSIKKYAKETVEWYKKKQEASYKQRKRQEEKEQRKVQQKEEKRKEKVKNYLKKMPKSSKQCINQE